MKHQSERTKSNESKEYDYEENVHGVMVSPHKRP